MEPNIVFSHVTKTYKGGVTALEDVSFSVGSGVFGCWATMGRASPP